jgi:hypothetical protein
MKMPWKPDNQPNGGSLDEIRWGESYVDVSPIPEPAAFLAFAGLLALLRRR